MLSDNTTPHAAGDYDGGVRRTIPYYEQFHAATLALVQAWGTPRRWLDTGCGTGSLVGRALPLFPETTFVLADPAPGMLAVARERLAGAAHVTLLDPATTQALTRAMTGECDVITAIQAHHYLSPPQRAVATDVCHALLAPGGLYVTFENIRAATAEGLAIGQAMWGAFQQAHGKSPAAVAEHLSRFDREYFPLTLADHLALLHATGFRSVEVLWVSVMQAGLYAIK